MSSHVTDGPAGPEGALPLTGERTVPGLPEENYWFRRHEVVYQRLRDHCVGADVLEAGCGEGYGADLIADVARRVIALDYDEATVAHVRASYPRVDVRHGNLAALHAVLDDARRQGAEGFVVMGDLAFKGPQPAETVQVIRDLAPLRAIVGNTDQWLFQGFPDGFNPPAERRAQLEAWRSWALARLGETELAYLQALPFSAQLQLGSSQVLFVHSSPRSTEDWFPSSASDAELEPLLAAAPAGVHVLVCGHIHTPYVRRIAGRTVVNTGSVGNPVDGDPRASYLLLEADGAELGITLRRVPYDLEATCASAARSGFPLADAYAASLRAARAL